MTFLTSFLAINAGHAQTASEPPPPAPQLGPAEPSPEARREIDSLQQELDAVDSLLLQSKLDEARERLSDAQGRFDKLSRERGGEVPQGYVPAFVIEEKLGALRQQIDEKAAGSE
ncbi:hypothetical protein [Arboricoccus pini]|uniref:hypothetical protein n=1 Tax=Arboricoccus pini TaxID=1963835 RepID=UPI000B513112|nr:hypothetical protein [Arboricoccus pini]